MSESWLIVRRDTGLLGWTMTAIASRATTSRSARAPSPAASSNSSSFISREALAMSAVPLISAVMPVPVPPPVTEMRTSGRLTA